jgi:pyruvate,water dikinase
MGQPRFKEQTIDLLASVGRYMKLVEAGQLERQIFHQPQTIWQTWQYLTDAADGLRRWLSWRALVGIPLIAVLRHLFRLREAIRTAEAKGMAAVRRWDLAQANRWVQRNYLDKEEDYFWLTLAEIERALVMEVEGGISLKPAVQARKESYQILAETQTPLVIRDADIPHLALDADYSQAVLSGTLVGLSVSPGQVQGVVKILEETDTVEQIPAGSILVTPSTDPALLPFFPLAAGLIVEVGGMLSHGSIIAREYGIPAVSNITDARKRLKSGDRVLLDGSTGVIQILEKAP